MRTGTFGRVEGEFVGCGVAIRDARRGAHQALGEVLQATVGLVEYHYHAVALAHGGLHAAAQPLVVLALHLQLVDHHLDVVVLEPVYFHAPLQLHHLAVYPHVQVAFLAHALEELAVVSLALSH